METVNIKWVVLSYFSLIDRNRARKIVSRRSTIISCSVILFSQSEYRLNLDPILEKKKRKRKEKKKIPIP